MARIAIVQRPPAFRRQDPELVVQRPDIDLDLTGVARRSLDTVGHYSRPDLFRLHVNTAPLRPVEFGDPPG